MKALSVEVEIKEEFEIFDVDRLLMYA